MPNRGVGFARGAEGSGLRRQAGGLPVLLRRDPAAYVGRLAMGEVDPAFLAGRARAVEAAGLPLVDHFGMTPGVETARAREAYEQMVGAVPAGLGFLAFHCNAPGDIEAIVPPRAQWRIDEYDLFRDRGFLEWIAGQDLHLIGFRAIRDWWRRQRDRP